MDKLNKGQLREILKEYWGYEAFRPLQEEIILHVGNGQDALALLPTGGGKSVCFQVPALGLSGLCIVVSPLIALMRDQVENLKKRGIAAEAIYTGLSPKEVQLYLDQAVGGILKFLYVSPERLQNQQFLAHFKQMKVCLLAVDEAHCVSQWGYDFRPPYLQIADLRTHLLGVPLLALTATATPDVVDDIQEKLCIRPRKVFRKSFVRENLTYYVVKEEDKNGRLCRAIRKIGGCGVVYVRNRRKTLEVAELLCAAGISAAAYHAGLETGNKNRTQEAWMQNKVQVMVATNAFGMGIDKPDVRFVIHLDLPETLEAYFQEAGRGGRDGKPSFALLMYNEADRQEACDKFEKAYPSISFIKQVYEAFCNYYRLPLGMGEGTEMDFLLKDFVNEYRLPWNETVSALGFLERDGYLRFSDNTKASSKVHITADKDVLYRLEVNKPDYDPLLKALLRMYGGRLFCDYVPISEREMGQKIGKEAEEISQMLLTLHTWNYIDYQPLHENPSVVFLRSRIDPGHCFLTGQVYSKRKEVARVKLDAVLEYAKQAQMCRSSSLVSYFGEKHSKPCGHCDFCIRKEREGLDEQEYAAMYESLRKLMGEKAVDIRLFCDSFPAFDQDKCCLFWQYLLDKGLISEDPLLAYGFCRWTSS